MSEMFFTFLLLGLLMVVSGMFSARFHRLVVMDHATKWLRYPFVKALNKRNQNGSRVANELLYAFGCPMCAPAWYNGFCWLGWWLAVGVSVPAPVFTLPVLIIASHLVSVYFIEKFYWAGKQTLDAASGRMLISGARDFGSVPYPPQKYPKPQKAGKK